MSRASLTYIRALAREMGLEGWSFEISPEPASKRTVAEIEVTYGQRHATIFLCNGWARLSPVEQRAVLVHELVHALLAPLTELAGDLGKASMRKNAAKVARAALTHAEERVVDQIAEAWSPRLPLPGEHRAS